MAHVNALPLSIEDVEALEASAGFTLGTPIRGRPSADSRIGEWGELTTHHINVAQAHAAAPVTPLLTPGIEPVKQLRYSHHRVARLVAEGLRDVQTAALTGYSAGRIASLKADPAFQDLVAHYKSESDDAWKKAQLDFATIASELSMDALQEIRRRLDETPEQLSTTHLMEVVKTAADRSGNGPQTKNMNVNVNVGMAAEMSAARARRLAAQQDQTPAIEGTVLGP